MFPHPCPPAPASMLLRGPAHVERTSTGDDSPSFDGRPPLAGVCVRALRVLVLVAFSLAALRADGVDEYELKAAFLGKFVKYVTWPAERLGEKREPLVLAVLGHDPFGRKLDQAVDGLRVNGHALEVRRVEQLHDLAAVHVLFVPQREAEHLDEILGATHAASVLVVGESPDFAARGGAIGFYVDKEKLRFEVNLEAARRQNLRISADLLKVARIVKDGK